MIQVTSRHRPYPARSFGPRQELRQNLQQEVAEDAND